MPIRTRRCSGAQGQPATSTWAANGATSFGLRHAAVRLSVEAGVVVVEVVDQLLDPHGIGRRQRVHLHQELPHVGVGGRVDVDRERRDGRAALGLDERVLDDARVLVAGEAGAGAFGGLQLWHFRR